MCDITRSVMVLMRFRVSGSLSSRHDASSGCG